MRTKVNTKELAEVFGVTRQTIHEWVTQKGCPKNADQSFNLTDVIHWHEGLVLDKVQKMPERYGMRIVSKKEHEKQQKIRLRLEKVETRIDEIEQKLFESV